MGEQHNTTCSICGTPYKTCRTCTEIQSFRPWRTVTDTIEHYMIYTAIHGYTISKNKQQAKLELSKCNLVDISTFNQEVQDIIREIMEEQENKSDLSTKRKNRKSELKNDENNE